jgi:hypothetical protein
VEVSVVFHGISSKLESNKLDCIGSWHANGIGSKTAARVKRKGEDPTDSQPNISHAGAGIVGS